MATKFCSTTAKNRCQSTFAGALFGLFLIASAPLPARATDVAADGQPALSPPPADPHDIEGVWKPSRSAPPPNQGAAPAAPPSGPPVVAGSTLVCAPVQRLGGAGGGMSNLWVVGPKEIVMISEEDQDVRKIYPQSRHPKNPEPQPNGNSISIGMAIRCGVQIIAVA